MMTNKILNKIVFCSSLNTLKHVFLIMQADRRLKCLLNKYICSLKVRVWYSKGIIISRKNFSSYPLLYIQKFD